MDTDDELITQRREERDREVALSTAGIVADCDVNSRSLNSELLALKFLVVDRSRFYRTMIKTALAAYRMTQVIEVADGEVALEALQASEIDFVLTDSDLPGMSGTEFVRTVRWSEKPGLNAQVPIIMITDAAETDVVVQARNAGIHEFLRKPVVPRDLYERIRKTVLQPRPFISVKSYRGPDRRWIDREVPAGAAEVA